MTRWVQVAREDEIAPGEFKLVEIDDLELALFNVDGKLCCIEDLCTHDGGNLVEGDFEGSVVTCPRHGARFDVRNGEAICLPAVEKLQTYKVVVQGENIMIELDGDDL